MQLGIYENPAVLGREAARIGATAIRAAIKANGEARIILATGASQFTMLEQLIRQEGIDWSKVDAFHLDEYVGIPVTHKASFRKYLKERFADKVPSLRSFTYVEADAPDLKKELKRLADLIGRKSIDVAFIGIGENGHLAFNDPPADCTTEDPYIVVQLDDACKQQQVGEGWFASLEVVPKQAVSMSMRQILKSRTIICTVPDARKAAAIDMALHAPVGQMAPCAYLRSHADCYLVCDRFAAAKVVSIAD